MKLSEYAEREGIGYRAAWNRYKAGRIDGAFTNDSGHIIVPDKPTFEPRKAVVYARVSTHKQAADLHRQADRMTAFATASGYQIVDVVKEIASGVNDERPKLTRLLERDDWGTLIVEHKDRLSRVGFRWFEVLLKKRGKTVVVANLADGEDEDLMEDFVSIIYSFSARMYGKRSAKRRARAAWEAIDDKALD